MIRNIENERQQINLRAKKAYENIFGKPKVYPVSKRLNSQEMYDYLKLETQRQLLYFKQLKQSYLYG